MSDAATVQKAIFSTLKAALLVDSVDIFDHVSQGEAKPYVVLDAQDITPRDYLVAQRDFRRVYLSIWSDYRGQKEVLDIYKVIYDTLHRQPVSLDNGRMVRCEVERFRSIQDADGLTYTGTVTLKLITE